MRYECNISAMINSHTNLTDEDILQLPENRLSRGENHQANKHAASFASAEGEATERGAAIVCAPFERAERIAELLARHNYEVFIAESAASVVAQMRENQVAVVILDADFSFAEDGATCVRAMINRLQLAERRQVFLVGVADDARTMDAHAAFVQSINLVVNISELDCLPDALERTRWAHEKLYAEFNKVVAHARI